MAYDWSKNAQGDGNREGERLSPGNYIVKCVKVIMGRDGQPWQSKNGDPQVMIAVANEKGEEGTVFFTLSEKAAWALSRWLSKSGVDLKAMEKDGIEPADFADEATATKYLLGKKTRVEVKAGSNPKYPEITPIDDDGSKGTFKEKPKDDDLSLDDIPF